MLKKLDRQKEKEEVNTVRFEGGKFCLDIAKFVIAGVIIAGVMKQLIQYLFIRLVYYWLPV